jgi:hypothetical protein
MYFELVYTVYTDYYFELIGNPDTTIQEDSSTASSTG